MHGFTLVELLVVVSIIALLVGILLPSIGKAIKVAANTRTSVRIAELAGGCNMYHTENGYYPGQRYSHKLTERQVDFDDPLQYTGSQVLGVCLFGQVDKYSYININSGPVGNSAESVYAPLKRDIIREGATETFGGRKDDLQTISDQYNSIWDRNDVEREVMAILYYPAMLGVSGLGQYRMGDNVDYKNGNANILWRWTDEYGQEDSGYNQEDFENYIKDRRFQGDDSEIPYAPGAFLIIAAGMDRAYGTSDDIRYPAFKSE